MENDVTINFLHPPGPSNSFNCPSAKSPIREDTYFWYSTYQHDLYCKSTIDRSQCAGCVILKKIVLNFLRANSINCTQGQHKSSEIFVHTIILK